MRTAVSLLASWIWLWVAAGILWGQNPQPQTYDKAFWRAIAANKYQVPQGQNQFELARELSSYLGSPDPELRDDLGYTILAVWIVNRRQLAPEELLQLEAEWQSNLRFQVGETVTDSVLRRSFSALCLSALAERELKTPFLEERRFRALLDAALAYLREERDLRGFDAAKGWIHATAHTADLLAALAGNRQFAKQDQAAVLRAISLRLATAGEVFTYGEQDRLGNVVAVIAARPDFDPDAFRSWLGEMDRKDQAVWNDTPPKMAELTRFENDSYLLRAIAARLSAKQAARAPSEAQAAVLKSLALR